jgi:hypothetical protein
MQEVTACASHDVLVQLDVVSTLAVCDPLGILGKHLRPHKICSLNILDIILVD